MAEEKGQFPEVLPSLEKHDNYMANYLRDNRKIWDDLKDKPTKTGVTLAQCIKTGIENANHPYIKTVGLTAGDEFCFDDFKDLFYPIISQRHGLPLPLKEQPIDMSVDKISKAQMDPSGEYVLTTRVRTARNVAGFQFPTCISKEKRLELEKSIVKCLNNLTEEKFQGTYYALGEMSDEQKKKLRSSGRLFQEPDSPLLIASGCARDWPSGRGIFINKEETLMVWICEEDHMRIICLQNNNEMGQTFAMFSNFIAAIQKEFAKEGLEWMRKSDLGWLTACPSNLGTGIRAGALVKLPLLSQKEDFKDMLYKMRLQARGTGGVDSGSSGGVWDISNKERMGFSAVELVNVVIDGIAKLIAMEKDLEKAKAEQKEE